jgi:hypothetical protein
MNIYSTQCTVDNVNLALLQTCYPNVKEIDVQFIGVWPTSLWPERYKYITGIRATFDGVLIELQHPHNNRGAALRFVDSEDKEAAETLLTDALIHCAEWVKGEIKELQTV